MATCKECLHFNVCESFCGGIPRIMMLGNNAERDCGYYKPTADVVPKREVDMLHHLLKDAWKRIEELSNLCGELQKAEAEVAREIFEDIWASIATHAFTSKSEDYEDGAYDTIEWVDSKIAEVEKKYTEGESNGSKQ